MSRRCWIGILVLGLTARIGLLLAFGSARWGLESAHHEHASIARNLATGNGFRFNFFGHLDQPVLTSIEAPFVPGLLAGSYCIFGVEARSAFLAVLLLQCVVGALTGAGVAWLGGSLCNDAKRANEIARWTGLAAAMYPPLVVSSLHIQALVWNLGWLTLMLVGTQCYRMNHVRCGGAMLAAAGIGGLLTDPILGAVFICLFGLLAVESVQGARCEHKSANLRPLFVVAAAIGMGVAPWLYRNYLVHGHLAPIKDSLGFVFWQGNHHGSQGTDKLLVKTTDSDELATAWNPIAANRLAFAARSRTVSVNSHLSAALIQQLQGLPTETDRMNVFRKLAWQEVLADPGHYAMLCARRLRYLLWFDATHPRSYLWHYRLSYLVLVGLAVTGLWGTGRLKKRWRPIWIAAAALATVHILIITSARFRIPLELLLLPLAGFGIDHNMRIARAIVARWWNPTIAVLSKLSHLPRSPVQP